MANGEDLVEIELLDGTKLSVPRSLVPAKSRMLGTSTPEPRTPARRGGRAPALLQFYENQGLPRHQAAGIVGNFMQESGSQLNPTAVGDNGTAFGIGQWRGKRFANLKNFAGQLGTGWKDTETQALFALWEMGYEPLKGLSIQGAGFGSESAAGSRLFNAETVQDATKAVAGFERPRGWKGFNSDPSGVHGWSNRLNFAEKLAGQEPTGSLDISGRPPGVDLTTPRASGDQPTFNDSIRSRLQQLIQGKTKEPIKKRSKGNVVGDIIQGAAEGLAAGASGGGGGDIPPSPFPSPSEFGAMSQRMANSGPLPGLPSLGEGFQRFGDLF